MVQLQLQFANKLRDRSLIMFQDKSAQIFPNKFATMSQDTTFKENLQEEMSLRWNKEKIQPKISQNIILQKNLQS